MEKVKEAKYSVNGTIAENVATFASVSASQITQIITVKDSEGNDIDIKGEISAKLDYKIKDGDTVKDVDITKELDNKEFTKDWTQKQMEITRNVEIESATITFIVTYKTYEKEDTENQ